MLSIIIRSVLIKELHSGYQKIINSGKMVKSSPINIIWIKSRILSAEGAHLGRGSMRWILSTGRALLHGRNKLSVKIYNLV